MSLAPLFPQEPYNAATELKLSTRGTHVPNPVCYATGRCIYQRIQDGKITKTKECTYCNQPKEV